MIELIGKEDVKLSKKQVNELIDLMDKEEVLEVEDQIQKALTKENKDLKSEAEKSTVPSTPLTKADKPIKEELSEETSNKATMKNSKDEELHDTAPVLKDSDAIKTPPITGVPPPPTNAKKAEGSKQL